MLPCSVYRHYTHPWLNLHMLPVPSCAATCVGCLPLYIIPKHMR
jgi:hypothetical protein